MRSKFISADVIRRLRKAMGAEAWLPFEVALQTGLRIGDVASLPCSAVRMTDGGAVIDFTAAKTGKEGSARISAGLYKKLSNKGGLWLFPGNKPGRHITRQALWARMKAACASLGVDPDGISPHGLRKTFAVRVRQRSGFAAARDALQHNTDAVTRVYAYADTIMRAASDDPIRWNELELIVEYVLERLKEGG